MTWFEPSLISALDSPDSLGYVPVLSERHIGHAPPTPVRVDIHQCGRQANPALP
nr:MAG TPA: hypothetical protein [Siphoviridae sp. ctl617]